MFKTGFQYLCRRPGVGVTAGADVKVLAIHILSHFPNEGAAEYGNVNLVRFIFGAVIVFLIGTFFRV